LQSVINRKKIERIAPVITMDSTTVVLCFLSLFGLFALVFFAAQGRKSSGVGRAGMSEEEFRRKESFSRILSNPALQSPENRNFQRD
jgi:hypothetical protein